MGTCAPACGARARRYAKMRTYVAPLEIAAVLPLRFLLLLPCLVPRWSGGFIPYARVVHAKYMVVDGQSSWLGTSNWERDYFTETRNVGLIVEGAAFARELERYFSDTWTSPYTAEVDPRATYTPPPISSEP